MPDVKVIQLQASHLQHLPQHHPPLVYLDQQKALFTLVIQPLPFRHQNPVAVLRLLPLVAIL